MAGNERMILQNEQEEQEIDLIVLFTDILRGIRKYGLGCIALCLVLGCIGLIVGAVTYSPEYVSRASFTVQMAQTIDGSDVDRYSFNYNSSTASRLSAAFKNLLQSDLMRRTVMQDLGLDGLESNIAVTALNDSNMFTLTVTDSSAQRACDVANSILENYSRVTDGTIGDSELYVLMYPSVPGSAQNRLSAVKMAIVAAALGVVLSGVFILAYAMTRSTVRTREEVRTKLNQRCLAVLPKVKFMRGRRQQAQIVHFKNRKTGAVFRESVRGLRTTILKVLPKGAQVLMVTSTAAGEGKTTVAANLAAMLAMMGRRVLLIDADLRAQSVLNTLGLNGEKRPGLAEVLRGEAALTQAIRAEKDFRIALMAGTEMSADAAKLLNSRELPELFERLKEAYDFIVCDCPPCGLVADAAVLAGMADAAVLVVRQDAVNVPEIIGGIENLAASGVPLLGCVLNGAEGGMGSYGQYGRYGRYGGYGYGNYGYGGK